MSGPVSRTLRDGAMWIGAGALVLSAHVATAAWIMQHDDTGAPEGPVEAVFVDLVPPAPAPDQGLDPAQGDPETRPAPPSEPVDEVATTPPPDITPEPVAEPAPLPQLTSADLPELQTLPPPRIPVEALVLEQSSRPARRPAPTPQPEPERRAEPTPRAPEPVARAQPPQGQGGKAAQAPRSGQASGSGGASAAQRASAINAWGAQIRNCINRRIVTRGIRQGGSVTLALTISRSGAIQGLGIAGSSGQPEIDQAAVNGAQRAGRCPAAPAALDQPSYPFQLPIRVNAG